MNLDQSSFLDKKLLSSLNHSSHVQSQLKLSLQSNKSQLRNSVRHQATKEEQERNRITQEHLLMCLKLFDESKVMNNLKSFLTLDVYQALHSSYKARKKAIKAAKAPAMT